MTDEQSKELLKHVNSSGFPFQIAVAESIDQTTAYHKWKVEAVEHRWRHPEQSRSGFADIITGHADLAISLIIECKRMKKDGALIFLTSKGQERSPTLLSSFSVLRKIGSPFEENLYPVQSMFWWDLICTAPSSYTSMFCSFKNQDERNPMLERITDELLPATEAVAIEFIRSNRLVHSYEASRQFIPIIVTNSKLYQCSFDNTQISLATGEISEEAASISEIPFIVFKKSLSSYYESTQRLRFIDSRDPVDTKTIASSNEKSIFVINSEHLSEAIASIQFKQNAFSWWLRDHLANQAKIAEKHRQTT